MRKSSRIVFSSSWSRRKQAEMLDTWREIAANYMRHRNFNKEV